MRAQAGPQFNCFTATKVQILTLLPEASSSVTSTADDLSSGIQFTCFSSTKEQILTPEEPRGPDHDRQVWH